MKKIKKLQWIRIVIQGICFIYFPALFSQAFLGIKNIFGFHGKGYSACIKRLFCNTFIIMFVYYVFWTFFLRFYVCIWSNWRLDLLCVILAAKKNKEKNP